MQTEGIGAWLYTPVAIGLIEIIKTCVPYTFYFSFISVNVGFQIVLDINNNNTSALLGIWFQLDQWKNFQRRRSLWTRFYVYWWHVRCDACKCSQTHSFLPVALCVYPLGRVYRHSLDSVLRSTWERKQLFTQQTTHINKSYTLCLRVCV